MTFEPEMVSDEALARASQAGSMVAFEDLVRRYEARVYRFVLQLCRNPADASELTQDTFVKAYRAMGGFDPRQSFGAWLFTIARRKCIDHHRQRTRRASEAGQGGRATECAPYLGNGFGPSVSEADPAETLAAKDEGQAIWDLARNSLSASQFQALWLRYAEDLSLRGTARILRKPETYVKVLLFRARQVLCRKLLREAVSPEPGPVAGAARPQQAPARGDRRPSGVSDAAASRALGSLGLSRGSLGQPHSQ